MEILIKNDSVISGLLLAIDNCVIAKWKTHLSLIFASFSTYY